MNNNQPKYIYVIQYLKGENCGETIEQFGVDNLFPNELKRLNMKG